MTLIEFEQLCVSRPDDRYEMDEGELITLSPTARLHGKQIEKIFRYLIKVLPEKSFDVLPGELGFVLSVEPKPTVRGADLAVLYPKAESELEGGFEHDPPLIAIEVVSPGNDPEDLEKKRLQYIEAGSGEVWIVYPKTKTMHVWQDMGRKMFVVPENGTFWSESLHLSIAAYEFLR